VRSIVEGNFSVNTIGSMEAGVAGAGVGVGVGDSDDEDMSLIN